MTDITEWMLDTDPALRWQVERDIVGAPPEIWQATRSRVAAEGFGAQTLALQDPDGQWAGGAYFPSDASPDEEGQPWTSTTWALNQLREWGVDAAVLGDTAEKLAANSRWEYDDLPYWGGEVDCCINGYTIANGAWLGVDVSGIAQWFLDHRMSDGGWNCAWEEGSTKSSFHWTLNALKGILSYEKQTGGSAELTAARHAAEEYLLERRLLFSLTSGELVAPWVDKFVYPFRWFYSVLNAAEYFREASLHDDTPPDPRLEEAVELIRGARQEDGTWMQARRHPGRVWFEVDAAPGEPSPWLTFYATRVLAWWDSAR